MAHRFVIVLVKEKLPKSIILNLSLNGLFYLLAEIMPFSEPTCVQEM